MSGAAHSLRVGDIVTREGSGRLRVVALYDDADEVVVEAMEDSNTDCAGDKYDQLWFDLVVLDRAL